MESRFSLKDRVAIVTGSGGGIGKAIAVGFAEAGADVVVVELNSEAAAATASEVGAQGRRALQLVIDVEDARQVEQMVQRTMDEFGSIDILVNNVGGLREFEDILEMEEQAWDGVFGLNVKTAFLCSRAVARTMIGRGSGGSIVNLSSIAGFSNRPGLVHYGSAKAAVRLLTDGLAKEWAPHGIRVNAIAPANIKTPLRSGVYQQDPQLSKRRIGMVPLGREGSPDEIAAVAVFLASDASSYVTGQTILVSGGLDSLVEPRQGA